MKRLIFFLEYLIFRSVAFLIGSLPLAVAESIANSGGWLLFHSMPRRRRIILENLKAALGKEKSPEEIKQIGIGAMQNMVKLAFEMARIPKFVKNPDFHFNTRSLEHMQVAVAKEKGMILLVSHYGNWELLALSGIRFARPLYAVARPIKNQFVYEYIKQLRLMEGVRSVDKGGAVRSVIKLIKAKKVVPILNDQHERQGAVWVDFFGRPAATSTFVAMLALRYDVPVVPIVIRRKRLGFYDVDLFKAFPTIDTGDYEADLFANTQQYAKWLEAEIRKQPNDWLWMHRRWRDKPKEVKELTEKS